MSRTELRADGKRYRTTPTKDGVTRPRVVSIRHPWLASIPGTRRFDVDLHDECRSRFGGRWFVVGTGGSGPIAIILARDAGKALDVWDEHYSERVDVVADASTLADYEPRAHHLADAGGDPVRARVFAATDAGNIRTNDGGTTVWGDPEEWIATKPGKHKHAGRS
jgi:hypothetical protein